jgi:hypothetical protein
MVEDCECGKYIYKACFTTRFHGNFSFLNLDSVFLVFVDFQLRSSILFYFFWDNFTKGIELYDILR